jgi:sortase (surface protein transpeptidase)
MLKDVKAGDSITVQLAGGRKLEYAVEDVKSIPKDAVTANPDLIYQASDDARLRLVTCGGIFDHSSRSYKNNTIVYARLRGTLP